jgi:hypothetical protein
MQLYATQHIHQSQQYMYHYGLQTLQMQVVVQKYLVVHMLEQQLHLAHHLIGASLNSADVTFPTATASWGTVGWIGINDAATSGNLLYHTALDTAKAIDSGDIFKISTGNLSVTLA